MNPEPDNTNATSAAAGDAMQFDKAEFTGTALTCEICKAPLHGEYYQVNGKNICPACRAKVDSAFIGGSKLARFGKAVVGGLAGGFAGFVIYWAVATFFHMELALIAIAVGWMVGTGVRWGSGGRGGVFYQLMSVAITYLAICSSYLPDILNSSRDSTLPLLLKVPIAMVLSLAVPWLEGPSNIIGWVIIAIGLYQAWTMNRQTPIQITGPYFTTHSKVPVS